MKFEKLRNIADIIAGQSPPSSTYNSERKGIPFFQGKADYGEKYPSVRYWCTEPTKISLPNDILISMRAPVGPVNINIVESCIGRGLSAIRVKKNVSRDFIYFWLKQNQHIIAAKETGSTFKAITQKILNEIVVPFPCYSDQLQIANLLSKAENLIAQRKESIRLLDEFLKSTFLEMFGDPVKNEKGWDTKTIEQLVKKEKYALKRGPFGGALKKEIFVPSGYLVYEQFHALNNDFSFARYFIDEAKFQELKGFEVKSGDIIVSCSGVYLGKLAIVPEGAKQGIINQALLKISLDNRIIENVFFVYVFSNENFKRKFYGNVIGTGIPNFPSMDDFRKFNFIYPPIKLQTQFAQIVEKTEVLKTKYLQSLQELENLYGSLSQKAFRGELVSKKSEAKVITLSPVTKVVQPELNRQQAFLRKLMLASHIINELCEESTFGHTKLMKLLYLSEQVGGMALQTNYKKFAAGPFDGKTLTLIDKEFEKNKWFAIRKNTFSVNGQQREATVYKKTDKSLLYKKHFDNYFESEAETINKIIELFRKEKTQMAEIVATLYFAWKELLTANTIISEDSLVKGFYQFHKEKRKFTKEQILLGYEYMQSNELYPQ